MNNPITRASKGAPLSHTEMDANFNLIAQLLQESFAKATGENATGTWSINITGTATGITSINPVNKGGTGASSPEQALQNLGAYPSSNPNNFISAQSIMQFIPNRDTLMIDKVNNTSDAEKLPSVPTLNLLSQKIDRSERDAPDGFVGLVGNDIGFGNETGGRALMHTNATDTRHYTFPDRSIMVAGVDQITGINSGTNTGDETAFSIAQKIGISDFEDIKNSNITKDTLNLGNVENKSVAQILATMSFTDVVTALGFTPQNANLFLNMLGQANGIATLGPDAFIKSEQLPPMILGGRSYRGTWNATTNTPPIASGVGMAGDFYKVSVGGTTEIDGEALWNNSDTIIFSGLKWERVRGDIIGGIDVNDVVGAARSAKVDATNASNIDTGTLAKERLPGLTGDVIANPGTGHLELVGTGLAAGNYGNSTKTVSFTLDEKNRITAVVENSIHLNYADLFNKPTTVSEAGLTDALSSTELDVPGGIAALDTNSRLPAKYFPTYLQSNNIISGIEVSGPLTKTAGQNPTITLPEAGSSQSGYLSATAYNLFYGKQDALGFTPLNANLKGVPNGLAELGPNGFIKSSQIDSSVFGGLVNLGSWNPNTNMPPLQDGVGIGGRFYVVSQSGTFTLDGNSTWVAKDQVMFNSTLGKWERIVDTGTTVVLSAQIMHTDVIGLAASATTDTTNASNINSGTLAKERLPAFTGDVIKAAGSNILTLADTTVVPGLYGAPNQIPVFIVNSKGQITDIGINTIDISDSRYRSIVLQGISLNDTADVVATDSILVGIGKLQAQVTANKTTANKYLPFVTPRGFANGVLIVTDLVYDASANDYWLLEITGHAPGSTSLIPIDFSGQGKLSAGTMTKFQGINNGTPITGLTSFSYNGKLCFWFPSLGSLMSYNVSFFTVNNGEAQLNRVTAVQDVVKPGTIAAEAAIGVTHQTLTSDNYATYMGASVSLIDVMIYS